MCECQREKIELNRQVESELAALRRTEAAVAQVKNEAPVDVDQASGDA